ncbi:MAG: thiol:disulfide interchange protein DsbA/DsbL [Burkholderia sp.]|jgi:thiol:disulfide interchange protein DsbA|nr:thiol:disulfide interchange protein DsbA/DsbL [Burkholderia sp.]
MRFVQHLLAALSLTLVAATAGAAPANPQNGVDYRTLDKVQQTDSGNKVEITEFFWYSCPHCFALEPALVEWVKKQGDKIVFKRVPVAFRDSFVPEQKLYYTLEAMGRLNDLHTKVFSAIHVDRQRLDNDAAITAFMEKQGVPKDKFLEVYNSFGVQAKARRAAQLQTAYGIDGVPMIAVDGRFLTAPSIVGTSMRGQSEQALHTGTLQVMDALVARAIKEKAPAAAEKKSK